MLAFTYKNVQYAFYMASRPQTLYAIADSPVGLAAWLLDHDPRSLEMIARSFDGVPEGLTPDDVLDNCSYFWLTNTGVSSSRLYRENAIKLLRPPKASRSPTAISVFPDELYRVPRSWAVKAYPKLIHFNKLPKGGPLRGPGNSRSSLRKSCARDSSPYAASGSAFREPGQGSLSGLLSQGDWQ
jgi:hypothetical protein